MVNAVSLGVFSVSEEIVQKIQQKFILVNNPHEGFNFASVIIKDACKLRNFGIAQFTVPLVHLQVRTLVFLSILPFELSQLSSIATYLNIMLNYPATSLGSGY